MHLLLYISVLLYYCMGISLLIRPVDQQRRQLAVRFFSKWYCAKSGVRSRCTSQEVQVGFKQIYIVCRSANIKVYQYQVMISND